MIPASLNPKPKPLPGLAWELGNLPLDDCLFAVRMELIFRVDIWDDSDPSVEEEGQKGTGADSLGGALTCTLPLSND